MVYGSSRVAERVPAEATKASRVGRRRTREAMLLVSVPRAVVDGEAPAQGCAQICYFLLIHPLRPHEARLTIIFLPTKARARPDQGPTKQKL